MLKCKKVDVIGVTCQHDLCLAGGAYHRLVIDAWNKILLISAAGRPQQSRPDRDGTELLNE